LLSILHFADAHIDMANYGRHDPLTGLPMRVGDFLKSLDTIIDTAIDEKVDLVLFAGDAYRDRAPAPTFQREWGRRIIRLSKAGIPTLLLVGNHDLSPSIGRANAMEEYSTLEVPHVRVLDKPAFLGPADLEGLPLQVLALPWVSRSGMMAYLGVQSLDPGEIYAEIEARLSELVQGWLEQADPDLPTVLTAHASVQGAVYGIERTVMLGADLVLPGSLVRDPRLDYVALGHIHKPQDLNASKDPAVKNRPPVIYPGSIERIDFGEAKDDKFFVVVQVERGAAEVSWRQLSHIRPFIDCRLCLDSPEKIEKRLLSAMPPREQLPGAIVRLVLEYPREWEAMIDEASLREYARECFEFHLVKRPVISGRIRLPGDSTVGSLSPLELLDLYWRANHTNPAEAETLQQLAAGIISEAEQELEM
jgi:exonuclease SbcD